MISYADPAESSPPRKSPATLLTSEFKFNPKTTAAFSSRSPHTVLLYRKCQPVPQTNEPFDQQLNPNDPHRTSFINTISEPLLKQLIISSMDLNYNILKLPCKMANYMENTSHGLCPIGE